MKDLLNKFSIFDFIAILLSGTCICTIMLLTLYFVYNIKFSISLGIDNNILFFVVSYLLGIIFQELGAFLYNKIIFKNDMLLRRTLNLKLKNTLLSVDEKKSVYRYFKKKHNVLDERTIYNYCKIYVFNKYKKQEHDRGISLSAMSRSLSVYSFMTFITMIVLLFFEISNINYTYLYIFLILLPLLSLIFFVRYLYFTNNRYANILHTFYYDNIV